MKKWWKRSCSLLLCLAMIMTSNFVGGIKFPGYVTAYASVEERPYYAKDLKVGQVANATYEVDGNSLKISFSKQYGQIHFLIPTDHNFSRTTVDSVTFSVEEDIESKLTAKLLTEDDFNDSSQFAFKYNSLTVSKENAGTEIKAVCLMNQSEEEVSVTLKLIILGLNTSTGYGDGTDSGELILQDYLNSAGGLGIGTRTGVCVPGMALNDSARMEIVTKHHNLVTCENEMKPDAILGYQPSYNSSTGFLNLNFSQGDNVADYFLKYNQEHGTDIKLRGHVLVWHSQTPDWFFRKNYDTNQPYVSKDEMLWREEQYIKAVFAHYGKGTKYENLFYCWDVVNETIDDNTKSVRTSGSGAWYNVFSGDDTFIRQAFVYANKYAPDHVKLFYNDYNDDDPGKRQGICKLLDAINSTSGARIDGMGMQAHYGVSYTSITNIENAIKEYSKRVNEVQLTELDFQSSSNYNGSNPQAEYEVMANKYAELYNKIIELNRSGASNVTAIVFWGTDDGHSWLNNAASVGGGADGSRPQCPMLFDANYQPKPAFYALIEASKNNITINTDAVQTDVTKLAKEYSFSKNASKVTFVPMWSEEGFQIKVNVADSTNNQTDKIKVFAKIGNEKKAVEVKRSEATEAASGYETLINIPASGLQAGSSIEYDIRVTNGSNVLSYGDITNNQESASEYYVKANLKSAPNYVKIPKGSIVVDGNIDGAWASAQPMNLSVKSEGVEAETTAKALWDEDYLYVLMQVTDANLDKSASETYYQDSVEVFIDENNHKSSRYESDDKQYRVNYSNEVSLNGTKCEGNIESATATTTNGYLVELAMRWTDIDPVVGDVIGFDVQTNDAKGGKRIGTENLFDSTGQGYQDTSVYGLAILDVADENSTKVQEVIDAINQIGTVSYPDSKTDITNARNVYDALDASQKQQISEETLKKLTDAEAAFEKAKEAAEDQVAIDIVVEKIKAIGTVSYSEGCKERIKAARDAYDALSDKQKDAFKIGDLNALTRAENDYKALEDAAKAAEDQAAIKVIDDLLAAIKTTTDLDAQKVLIDNAETAYNNLTDSQKTQATEQLAAINSAKSKNEADKAAAENAIIDDVIAKINAIGEVTYTPECKIRIDEARYAYNALADTQKAQIDAGKLAILTASEASYNSLKDSAESGKTDEEKDQARADEVSALISAMIAGINADSLTTEDKQKIIVAKAAYDTLTDVQKNMVNADVVSNLNSLIEKKQLADAQEENAKKEAEGKAAASVVLALIDAIGNVDGSQACRDRIVAAEEAYKVLKQNQQDCYLAVEKISALEEARTEFDAIVDADNQAAATAVENYINAIGTVDSSDACKAKIEAAENAYNALTDDQKQKVSQNAKKTLENAKTAYDKAVEDDNNDKPEVNDVEKTIELIKKIGVVTATNSCRARIREARDAYGKLTDEQKAEVGQEVLAVLESAEAAYEKAVAEKNNKSAIDKVVALIEAIGTVEFTDQCKNRIYEARTAYNALPAELKKSINSVDYGILMEAEMQMKALQAEADKNNKPSGNQTDKAVEEAINLIKAIGTVDSSEASKAKVEAARKAYDALNADQKKKVGEANMNALVNAEADYKKAVEQEQNATKPSPNPSQKPAEDNTKYFAKFSDKSTDIQKGKASSALAKDVEIEKGDKIVSWKSSNSKIVSVDQKGKIKAKKTGKVVITATTAKGKTAQITVNVKKKVVKAKKLKVTNVKKEKKKQTITLSKKKTFVLKTKLTPLTTTDKVTFKSSNSKVATVSKAGKITAKKAGSAKITAKAGKKSVIVYVKVK